MGFPAQRPRGRLSAGIDVGTTSLKAVVADEEGHLVASERAAARLVVGSGGKFEHDALATWWEAPRLALGALAERHRLEAAAVSAVMPSIGAVGPEGRPLGPGVLYGDARARSSWPGKTDDEPREGPAAAEGLPAAEEPPAAERPMDGDEMTLLLSWAVHEHPGASGYWPALAVANASIAGEGVIDFASAFAAGRLYNGSGWEPSVYEGAGLHIGQLPRVATFGDPVGYFRPATGEGHDGKVLLGVGSVDGLCELLVTGVVEEGDVLLALGSTLVVWLCLSTWPERPPKGLWVVPHVLGGRTLVGGASNAGGMWVDWADRVLRGGPEGALPALRPAEIPLWWPWANGERVPWHDPGLRIGLAGADLSHGPGALRRAALEATGFVARHILEGAAATCGTVPRRVIASGGGSARPDWLQALADVLGQPLVPMATPAGAALGAAFLARMAAGLETSLEDARRWVRWSGEVEPHPEWSKAADERYERWVAELPGGPHARAGRATGTGLVGQH
jgi:xylulokinase